jgi:mannitol 2-dehydrogenase
LTAASLSSLHPSVSVPRYDRGAVRAGIVHVGVGAFHRAHQAMYLDRLMNDGAALDWGICGVGVLPGDRKMRDALVAQDFLYTLVEKSPDGSQNARVIGSIVDYLLAPDDPEAVIEKMAGEQTRIVSLTVTEGGYNFNAVTGEFQADAPGVVHDLEPGATPTTTFGLIVEALVRRRQRGIAPFTVLSCDNVQGNGDAARRSFSAFARLRDEKLGDWVEREVRFPNCMVDRITPSPRTTTAPPSRSVPARGQLAGGVCEPFSQWVLEDTLRARAGRRSRTPGRRSWPTSSRTS